MIYEAGRRRYGVWGGTTVKERNQLAKARKAQAA